MNIIYLNGHYVSKETAKISVLDRGFLFGDGIYEVIPVYRKKPVGLDLHLGRLEKSLRSIEIKSPLSINGWKSIFKTLIQLNHLNNMTFSFYLQITRGIASERLHQYTDNLKPTVMVWCKKLRLYHQKILAQGLKAIVVPDHRREHCYVKSINLLPNILAYQQAIKEKATEAILIKKGKALEASNSNLFIVKNGILITPPLSPSILAGVTRHIILQLAKENNILYHERDIKEEELYNADEVWVTGSTKEICPITKLNNVSLNTKIAGPVWHKINQLYQNYKIKQQELW